MAYRTDEDARALLSRVRIATPCSASWDAMAGTDRVRHCGLCDRKVYDLSQLTAREAAELLSANGEELPCIRLHRRRDGTIITADCAHGARARKRRLLVLSAGAACASAIAAAYGAMEPRPDPAFVEVVPIVLGGSELPTPAALDEDAFFGRPPPVSHVTGRSAITPSQLSVLMGDAIVTRSSDDASPPARPARRRGSARRARSR